MSFLSIKIMNMCQTLDIVNSYSGVTGKLELNVHLCEPLYLCGPFHLHGSL